jgi:hypothetical protein
MEWYVVSNEMDALNNQLCNGDGTVNFVQSARSMYRKDFTYEYYQVRNKSYPIMKNRMQSKNNDWRKSVVKIFLWSNHVNN